LRQAGAGEHIAGAGIDAEEDQGGETRLPELVVEGQLLVDVGGAHDVPGPGRRHVQVVGLGLQTGGHHLQVDLGDEGVDHQIVLAEGLA
jgi:hypothetical protein